MMILRRTLHNTASIQLRNAVVFYVAFCTQNTFSHVESHVKRIWIPSLAHKSELILYCGFYCFWYSISTLFWLSEGIKS